MAFGRCQKVPKLKMSKFQAIFPILGPQALVSRCIQPAIVDTIVTRFSQDLCADPGRTVTIRFTSRQAMANTLFRPKNFILDTVAHNFWYLQETLVGLYKNVNNSAIFAISEPSFCESREGVGSIMCPKDSNKRAKLSRLWPKIASSY